MPTKKFREEFLIFGSPAIEPEDVQAAAQTVQSGWLGTGPKVAQFENAFKEYLGARYAMALNSCTAALNLALLVSGVGPGDEVITTPMTFCASANAIIHVGATPVFVDVNRASMNIDPDGIEAALTPRTKAILPVHFAGRPCAMDEIMAIADRHGLKVIEDSAHCIEGVYRGKRAGTIGDIGCFSFYVTKNLTTGEGGMAVTDRKDWSDRIKVYALHGMSKDAWRRYSDEGFKHYRVVCPGYKYNMMDVQAAIGLEQIKRIDDYLRRREELWQKYDHAFSDLPVVLPAPAERDTIHARHLYTLLLDTDRVSMTRDGFQQALYQMNIGTGIHYISLHLHDYYRDTFGLRPEDFPNATFISDRTISLPLSAKLTDQDAADVIASVRYLLS
jgi:dTDP-4-amino-4,6-dideoxygalactose transaminase